MSADNYILIYEDNPTKYRLFNLSASADIPTERLVQTSIPFAETERLEDAILKANSYMRNNVVEYGMSIDLLEDRESKKQPIIPVRVKVTHWNDTVFIGRIVDGDKQGFHVHVDAAVPAELLLARQQPIFCDWFNIKTVEVLK